MVSTIDFTKGMDMRANNKEYGMVDKLALSMVLLSLSGFGTALVMMAIWGIGLVFGGTLSSSISHAVI